LARPFPRDAFQRLKKKAAPDLHQPRALSEQGHDLRHPWHEPRAQGRVGRIAYAQPHDARTGVGRLHAQGKVLVLGHNHVATGLRVPPDRPVFGLAETDLAHRLRLASRFDQPAGERRGQLGIDQKLHRLATSTG
jgi:hypothetical protein